jgi:hypothetical protein
MEQEVKPRTKTIRASQLKRTHLVWIAGILMRFSHWEGGRPVFAHVQKGVDINYIDHRVTADSLIVVI